MWERQGIALFYKDKNPMLLTKVIILPEVMQQISEWIVRHLDRHEDYYEEEKSGEKQDPLEVFHNILIIHWSEISAPKRKGLKRWHIKNFMKILYFQIKCLRK